MEVKVKRVRPDAVIPKYEHETDSGFDLIAMEEVIIQPGETVRISTGIAVGLPPMTELQIRPRSGATWRTKLRVGNSPATIDEGFKGEIEVIIDNITDSGLSNKGHYLTLIDDTDIRVSDYYEFGTYLIRKGDRIAQGVICPIYRAKFSEADDLGESDRGEYGFGSTGTRS